MPKIFTVMCSAAALMFGAVGQCLAASTPVSGLAPDPDLRLSEYAYDYWGMDDGLPQNTAMTLAQSPDGYLWVGTFEGLARFDGRRFDRFVPQGMLGVRRSTGDLLFDPDGTLWIGTESAGIYRLAPNGDITQYGRESGLASLIVRGLYRDPIGRFWAATTGGLCQLQKGRFSCLGRDQGLPEGAVTSVVMAEDGALWVGTEVHGLVRIREDQGQVQAWQEVDGVPIERVQHLTAGSDGRLWAATFGSGLVEIRGEPVRVWGEADGLATGLIQQVLVDPLGSVWIGTYGAGLHRLADGRVDRLDLDSGLPNGHIQSLLIDREGSLWFGTSGGLNRLRTAKFVTLSTHDGLNGPFLRAVAQDAAGNLWIGTDTHGLNIVRDGQVVGDMRMPDLLSNSIRAFWPSADGGMWVGAYNGGVSKVHTDGRIDHYTPADGLASPLVRSLLEDTQGRVWVGSDRRGISLITSQGIQRLSINDDLQANDIRAIAESPDGSIWFGTYGRGLARYRDGELTAIPELANEIIFVIQFESDGTAWIGAEDGLFRFEPGTGFRAVATKQGLDGAVFQVLDDRLGNLWLCTNRGVVRLNRQALIDGSDPGPMQFFDRDYGMRSRQCNGATQPAGWRARDGSLWFPTANGVSWVIPGRLLSDPRPPPVVIQDTWVDDQPTRSGAGGTLVIPPEARRVRIDYAALTFIAPAKVAYRHRLQGFDEDWIDAGNLGSAYYNQLPPGQYEFRVIAANADGAWNEIGARLPIEKLPKVHQTLWFRLFALAILASLILVFIRWRSAGLRRANTELERQVQERTQSLQDANVDLAETLETLNATRDRLVESEKLASLGSLVSGVAHEINTPVGNGLTIATHLWERCTSLDGMVSSDSGHEEVGRFRNGLELIRSNLDRASNVVASFKRIDVGKTKSHRRVFKLSQVFSSARLDVVQKIQTRGHQLIIDCDEELELDSYPDALYEVMAQLILNSLDHAFVVPGGTIRISTERQEHVVQIDYRDDGVGMDALTRDRLFDPFFTSSRGHHAGLGMHIVYNITTQLLGGEVHCGQGPGAHFRILIPLIAPQQ